MYGTKMTRQCNVDECPNDVKNFLTVSLQLERQCDLSSPQAALAVKNYLDEFRQAVAKVLDLDLEKVQVSTGDTACPDKSRIRLKLLVAVQDLDASTTESKIMNHFEGDTNYRISDGSNSIAANKNRYNYKEIQDDRQELVVFLSIGGAIIAILSIALLIWAICCWRQSVRRKKRIKIYNQNEISCQTDDVDEGQSYEKMGADSYTVAKTAVGTVNTGSSGPKSKRIGNLRPGTAERVVREELARMQSQSSERTLIAKPRSLSRSRTNIMAPKAHKTVSTDSSTGTSVEMLEIHADDLVTDEVPTVVASNSFSTISPSRMSTNKLRMAWKRGSAFNSY